jgi:hypothetical protein
MRHQGAGPDHGRREPMPAGHLVGWDRADDLVGPHVAGLLPRREVRGEPAPRIGGGTIAKAAADRRVLLRRRIHGLAEQASASGQHAEQDRHGLVLPRSVIVAEEGGCGGQIPGRAQHPVEVEQPLGVAWRGDERFQPAQQRELRLGQRPRRFPGRLGLAVRARLADRELGASSTGIARSGAATGPLTAPDWSSPDDSEPADTAPGRFVPVVSRAAASPRSIRLRPPGGIPGSTKGILKIFSR